MILHVHFICLIHFLLLCELRTSNAQFPKHLDLQKVGVVDLDGNKYNVLKPTTHTITDYFKHFMLGEIRRYPNEKVFIDDNGFRHDWFYYDVNSRKHYIIKDTHTPKRININDFKKLNKTSEDNEESTDKSKTRKKPRRKKKVIEEELRKEPLTEDDKTSLREGGRTVARTTFFCPFFGVITMSSYID